MAYTLSYSSISKHNSPLKSEFGGSSKYAVLNGEIFPVVKSNTKTKTKRFGKTELTNCEIDDYGRVINEGTEIIPSIEENDIPSGTYKLNKSKVRKRCFALSRLEKSKKFLAFYTITFPEGLSDAECYQLYNTWLTRCRKTSGLTTYLWVAERQKNMTVHFHMLTNDFMKIDIVNKYMVKALGNFKKRGNIKLENVNTEIYNGIDVKKVGKKRKTLIGYLTKYITKNDIEFYRLPWHCSRNVSKLFTSQNVHDENSEKLLSKLPLDENKYNIHENEFCKVSAFKFIPDDKIFIDIDRVNELVYNVETQKN